MENILNIVRNPKNILREKAESVPVSNISSPRIQELIASMKATLADTSDGVGLAAPQVDISLKIFIISEEAEAINQSEREFRKEDGQMMHKHEKPYEQRKWAYDVFINPTVKNKSRKKLEDIEGCLSVPGKYGTVDRKDKITVEAYDEHGKKFTRSATKFVARVIQHELDHLEGTLFIDKVNDWVEME